MRPPIVIEILNLVVLVPGWIEGVMKQKATKSKVVTVQSSVP
jgi:hypothetical protein